MTEAEWLAITDPEPMLEWLCQTQKASDRKLLLFTCGCGRFAAPASSPADRAYDDALERRADGAVNSANHPFKDASAECLAFCALESLAGYARDAAEMQGMVGGNSLVGLPVLVAMNLWARLRGGGRILRSYSQAGADLLRDIFGPLPWNGITVDHSWLASSVPELSRAAYEERELPNGHLDNGRLAVLADALEENGCNNQELLGHLRQQGVHVRGCWVIDLLTGRQ